MPSASPSEKQLLERKLLALHDKTWLPPELLKLVTFTATAQAECRAACEPPTADSLPLRDSEAHWQGAPLLDKAAFPLHTAHCAALFGQLLDYMCEQQTGELQAAAQQVRTALKLPDCAGCPDVADSAGCADGTGAALARCFAAVLREQQDYFDHWAALLPAAPRLMSFLAYNSLVPSLSKIAEAALAAKPAPPKNGGLWQHGHCPVCGSAPFMGYLGKRDGKDTLENLQDTNGQRFHVCSFCRTEYRVKRLQCPFCLEEDNTKLEYFSAAEDPGYQVHVCHSCKGYIKIADFREYIDRPRLPALDDLECLPLDIAAQQQGFTRLTLSPWGF